MRVKSLDYLRGLMAVSVMIYHYRTWLISPLPPDSLLGKLGVYAVSIFYILSGLSLYLANHRYFGFNFNSFTSFAIKRTFRILPLLWLATSLTILLNHSLPSKRLLFFNYTGLFGLTEAKAGIARAAWSIGNEMVFYLFFPLFILLLRLKNKTSFYLAALATLVPAIWITYFSIDLSRTIDTEFQYYIHPLNQLLLFVAGIAIGPLHRDLPRYPWLPKLLLLVTILAFWLFPVESRIHLIAGTDRMVLCLLCCLLCYFLYVSELNPPDWLDRPLAFLGEFSYSIYLLHPIVYRVVSFASLPAWFHFLTSLILTLLFSTLVFRYLEKPAMSAGKRLVGQLYPPAIASRERSKCKSY